MLRNANQRFYFNISLFLVLTGLNYFIIDVNGKRSVLFPKFWEFKIDFFLRILVKKLTLPLREKLFSFCHVKGLKATHIRMPFNFSKSLFAKKIKNLLKEVIASQNATEILKRRSFAIDKAIFEIWKLNLYLNDVPRNFIQLFLFVKLFLVGLVVFKKSITQSIDHIRKNLELFYENIFPIFPSQMVKFFSDQQRLY